MDEGSETQANTRRRHRLVERVGQMVRSGRLTEAEAERLRATEGQDEFDEAVRDIRVRHAGTSLGAAVDEGRLSQDEADGLLERLRGGEHSRSLRARVRRLRPSADSNAGVADSAGPEEEGQEDSSA